ncbi:Site-specific recombinase XerD, partial [Roseovarius marisflavi]
LCHAELEALARVAERDEGDFTGQPTAPIIVNAQPLEKATASVSLTGLWSDYVNSRVQAGFMRDGGKRQRPVIENLRTFLKHNNASRITKKDLLAWREHLMKSLSAKTVNDIYLSTVRSLFAWAADNDRLPENVADSVKQPKPRKVYGRERGYTDVEAVKVLKASRTYQSKADEFGRVRESDQMANLKRWVPIICAFTGARVSEITQLRKEDIRKTDGHLVARITPDAGTVKSGDYRDVPLHPQIIEQGFAQFVSEADPGPMFHNATAPEKFQRAAVIVSNKLSDWLRESGLRPEGLQPNHAWRHRFKTQCIELGISPRVYDAIQGHAAKSASDGYGDVSLKAKIDAISRLPEYELS